MQHGFEAGLQVLLDPLKTDSAREWVYIPIVLRSMGVAQSESSDLQQLVLALLKRNKYQNLAWCFGYSMFWLGQRVAAHRS